MTTYCRNCGNALASGVDICPVCGVSASADRERDERRPGGRSRADWRRTRREPSEPAGRDWPRGLERPDRRERSR